MSWIPMPCSPSGISCFNKNCSLYGCQKWANYINTHMAIIPPVTQGCICPPTSEQTCLNDRCPRKPWKPYTMIPTPTEPRE